MRKKFKVVPFEFASIWKNLSSIFTEEEAPSYVEECSLPRVAWEKVNRGALKKFPTPRLFAVHSVSPDASFYKKNCKCTKNGPCSCRIEFEAKKPFGSLPGFKTNVGIVPVPSTPLFGHIWDQESNDWLLHAEVPLPAEIPSMGSHQDKRRAIYRRSRAPETRRTRGRPRRRR